MSNLYKQPFVVQEKAKTRVINSNEIIAKKLRELQHGPETQESAGDGFTQGIAAPEVEVEPDVDYVAEAKAEAELILSTARSEAEALRQQAEIQAQDIRESAHAEGYQKGYEESTARAGQELALKEEELEEKKQELLREYDIRLKEMEPQLLDVILKVVEKVFQIQFSDKKEILLYLLSNAINGIEGCKHFLIRVSRENYQFVSSHKDDITARISEDVTIEVIADAVLEEDKCMIDTDAGIFDCTLGVQLENLIKTLRSLCA